MSSTKFPSSASLDALLLVSSDASAAGEELARRLSDVADARPLRLGANAGANLTSVLENRPPRVVAAPLSLLAGDSMLEQLDGLLGWAKSRWPDATFLRSEPLGSTEHVVGWASRRARDALARWADRAPTGGTALLVVGIDRLSKLEPIGSSRFP